MCQPAGASSTALGIVLIGIGPIVWMWDWFIRTSFADATREVDGRPVAATVSIGIVISHDAVLDLSALLAQADHALYRAKDNGRNRVEIASIELILDRANRGAADVVAMPAAKSAARSAA